MWTERLFNGSPGPLVEVVGNLARVADAEEFDGWLDELYDMADYVK
jgi:hypothetical protein